MDRKGDNGQQKETSMVLDLSDFVTEVDRFSRLIEPFALVFYTIDDIRRWRFRNGTIIVWLLCNLACFWLTQGALFVLASSLVIAIATLSLFQVHTQILSKLLPSNKKPEKSDNEEEEGGALDTVQNFRYSLIEMHDFVVKSNEYLSYFYSILKWDAIGPSAIYHVEVCVFLLSIVVCPARWNCFLLINWFFLCHPHIIRKGCRFVKEYWSALKQPSTQKEQISVKKSDKDKDKCDNDDINEDDDSSDLDMTDDVADSSMVSLDPSPSKPGMVARLMELKKRRMQISSAPAALKETVLVCCSCHALLVNQGDLASEASNKQGQGPD
uniref:TECPR1-like DysF domain-containing protein n=1 Tax=Arion vulgaris TaxID=1028688 RepID=A0A0B6ZKT2_9EUPU